MGQQLVPVVASEGERAFPESAEPVGRAARDSPAAFGERSARRTETAPEVDEDGGTPGVNREGAEKREGNWVRAKREVDSVRYDRAATEARVG